MASTNIAACAPVPRYPIEKLTIRDCPRPQFGVVRLPDTVLYFMWPPVAQGSYARFFPAIDHQGRELALIVRRLTGAKCSGEHPTNGKKSALPGLQQIAPQDLEKIRLEVDTLQTILPADQRPMCLFQNAKGKKAYILEPLGGLSLQRTMALLGQDLVMACGAAQGLRIMGRAVLKELIFGISSLHQREWIHHDIKPENVLRLSAVTARRGGLRFRLIDFGNMRLLSDRGQDLNVPGTPGYQAPEQVLEPQNICTGLATDIWGIGATLLHALTRNYEAADQAEEAAHQPKNELTNPFMAADELEHLEAYTDYKAWFNGEEGGRHAVHFGQLFARLEEIDKELAEYIRRMMTPGMEERVNGLELSTAVRRGGRLALSDDEMSIFDTALDGIETQDAKTTERLSELRLAKAKLEHENEQLQRSV